MTERTTVSFVFIIGYTVLYRKETKRITQNFKDLMEKTQNPKSF